MGRKGKRWTAEEDSVICGLVAEMGPKWSHIAKMVPGRTGKQCRERFHNQLGAFRG